MHADVLPAADADTCFQVRWSDDYPTSWEPEEHVSEDLIAAFAKKHPELFALPPAPEPVPELAEKEREAVGAA